MRYLYRFESIFCDTLFITSFRPHLNCLDLRHWRKSNDFSRVWKGFACQVSVNCGTNHVFIQAMSTVGQFSLSRLGCRYYVNFFGNLFRPLLTPLITETENGSGLWTGPKFPLGARHPFDCISCNSLYKKDYNFQGAYSIIVIKMKNEKEYEYSLSYMVQHKLSCIYWYNTQFNK